MPVEKPDPWAGEVLQFSKTAFAALCLFTSGNGTYPPESYSCSSYSAMHGFRVVAAPTQDLSECGLCGPVNKAHRGDGLFETYPAIGTPASAACLWMTW
jgi:hypothetical protein